MKYAKPHLSAELRAQITPHKRRDVKLIVAGVVFCLLSLLLVINLWPEKTIPTASSNDNAVVAQVQSTTPPEITDAKQVLGATTTAPDPTSQQFTQYTVKNGDTLFNISQQYNVRWDLIAQINSLSEPYVLHAGDVLKIPQDTTSQVPGKIYTVASGDTLVSIAKQFNVTVSDIIAVNPNLQQSSLITVGQVIKLP